RRGRRPDRRRGRGSSRTARTPPARRPRRPTGRARSAAPAAASPARAGPATAANALSTPARQSCTAQLPLPLYDAADARVCLEDCEDLRDSASLASPRLEPDRQPRRAQDVQGLARLPRLVARQANVVQPLEQVGQGDPRFEPRQGGAEAEVDAVAEGQVRIGLAVDVET